MGLRFRKSIKLGGGAKMNLSKSGVGFSWGVKGFRKTKKAGGGTRTTYSMPGTGVSYVKESGNTQRRSNTMSRNNSRGNNQSPNNKRKTWLWVLGWLCIFPLPLTILLLRKKEMKAPLKYGIIAVAWILYLIIALAAGGGSKTDNNSGSKGTQSTESSSTESTTPGGSSKGTTAESTSGEKINITEVHFSDTNDVTVKVGEKTKTSTVKVTLKNSFIYSADDVQFISENPEIAVITFIKASSGKTVYYEIEGISPGETFVYAASKDGSITSEKVKVIVPVPVEVESIGIEISNNTLALGETAQATAVITPTNADHPEVTWTSSDETVATIDDKGVITAVSGGVATITAKAANGVSATLDLNVDGTKRLMSLRVTHPRDDDNNIGDEWSYRTEINGESTGREIVVSVGETLKFYAKFTEEDDNPDVGEASKSYTVTEDDILNGFTITMDLYVKENGGKNSGKSAHFVVTYTFTGK